MNARAVALGRVVRTSREDAGLTQEGLARQVGIGTSTLRSIEAGTANGPSVYTVLDLLEALSRDTSELDRLMAGPE